MTRILLSWSSGKDSAWSLHVLRQRREYEIAGLLTTFNEAADRVAMHAVRRELVERQAPGSRFAALQCSLALAWFERAIRIAYSRECARGIRADTPQPERKIGPFSLIS